MNEDVDIIDTEQMSGSRFDPLEGSAYFTRVIEELNDMAGFAELDAQLDGAIELLILRVQLDLLGQKSFERAP